MIKLHTHTHSYRQEIEESFYTNFVRNVNSKKYIYLAKGYEFL